MRAAFSLQPRTLKAFGVDFLKKMRLGKNSENFGILKKRKLLSQKDLQERLKVVFTATAAIGKTESRNSTQRRQRVRSRVTAQSPPFPSRRAGARPRRLRPSRTTDGLYESPV